MTRTYSLLVFSAAVLLGASSSMGRTITLSDDDADQMAVIAAEAPRMSWAGCEIAPGVYTSTTVQITRTHSFLIRMSLDKVPRGSKIIKAEWVVPVEYVAAADTRLYVWRLVADWGAGVCHQFRRVRPQPLEWAVPGARGGSSDHAGRPTAVASVKAAGEQVVNVTRDVELWHSGAAVNNGWLITLEDDATLRLLSPVYNGKGAWKLRITYEPQ